MEDTSLRTRLTQGGWVDDLMANVAHIEIVRTGIARYALALTLPDGRLFEGSLWTSQKGRIEVELIDLSKSSEVSYFGIETSTEEGLTRLRARDCFLHCEQLDRGMYCLSMTRPDASGLGVMFRTKGYLCMKFVALPETEERLADAS